MAPAGVSARSEQHSETVLLAVVEAVVKRLRRGGKLLQFGGADAEVLGVARQAVDRIRVLRVPMLLRLGEVLRVLFGDLADGGLERRPILLLIGIQFEGGLEPGDVASRKPARSPRLKRLFCCASWAAAKVPPPSGEKATMAGAASAVTAIFIN
jgi:hypothetical protein